MCDFAFFQPLSPSSFVPTARVGPFRPPAVAEAPPVVRQPAFGETFVVPSSSPVLGPRRGDFRIRRDMSPRARPFDFADLSLLVGLHRLEEGRSDGEFGLLDFFLFFPFCPDDNVP